MGQNDSTFIIFGHSTKNCNSFSRLVFNAKLMLMLIQQKKTEM